MTGARVVVIAAAAAAALLALPRATRAEPPVREPRHVISLPLGALGGGGLAAHYERRLAARWSAAATASARRAAGADYASLTLGVGAELRRWLTGCAWRSSVRGIVGPYAYARLAGATTGLRDRVDDRAVGRAGELLGMAGFGYRFALWRRIELSGHAGFGVRLDLGAGAPARALPALGFGLSLGVMF